MRNLLSFPFIFVAALFFFTTGFISEGGNHGSPGARQPRDTASLWVDSVFSSMSTEEKVGQLFMIEAYSNRDSAHVNELSGLVRDFHIGGVIFFQGGPVRQAIITNQLQSESRIPLMIGIDGEWGLSMRLDSTIRFPRQMTLGATGDDSLVYRMGTEIARECRRMGIQMNFAPVVDVNSNPTNPVINSRSFGESRELVARMSLAYMKGMQDHGVLACAKHFPGHGNTDSDSHFTLPVVRELEQEIDSVALFPFRQLIGNGVSSVMVAHLSVPSIDTVAGRASSLSPDIVDGLLRKKIGFKGLIFTDALNMKGVADYYPPGELELLALKAGNDVLLFSRDVPKAFETIMQAIKDGSLDIADIDAKVKRILRAKYNAGLKVRPVINLENLNQDLNPDYAVYLSKMLYEKSVVLLENNGQALPLRGLKNCSIAAVFTNDASDENQFQKSLLSFHPMTTIHLKKEQTDSSVAALANQLCDFDYVIVGVHNTSTKSASGYGIPDLTDSLIRMLNGRVNVIVALFGNAYTLTRIPSASFSKALILAHEDMPLANDAAAKLIFGVSGTEARLPVSSGVLYDIGGGLSLNGGMLRLKESSPLEAGFDPAGFAAIDTIARKVIADKAAPGCQVLVSWKGRILYHKSFGAHTYDSVTVNSATDDVYDIASVTKIASTALVVMKLYDQGLLDINRPASYYFHELKNTNKRDLLISDIMTHTAGLKSWIPFWKETMKNGKPSYDIYHSVKDVNYSVPVCDSLYMLKTYRDVIWNTIFNSELDTKGKLVYSDLGILIMQRVVEQITGESIESYVTRNFYEPLGLTRILFNPSGKIPGDKIPPTEMDTAFRKRLVHGFVHDPASAMLGGVAGHAGLFSDSYSLAVILQMLMNGGEYGGTRFLKGETIKLFTSRFFPAGDCYRGLMFDKPDTRKGPPVNTAVWASPFTFGHTGFTGTAAWADPGNDLIFVFLSNRVYPDASVNKLAKGNYRTDMMQAAYKAVLSNNAVEMKH